MNPVLRRRLGIAGVTLALLVTSACGEDALDTQDLDEEAPEGDTGDEAAMGHEGDAVVVDVAEGDLGTYLVDGDGLTLYLFTEDSEGESVCYDDCATNWPPLLADDVVSAGDGIDDSLLGTATRDDGSEQVTYDGWPLYHWAGDDAPGDVNGQGVQDVWYVVAPDGSAITSNIDEGDDTDDAEENRDSGTYEY